MLSDRTSLQLTFTLSEKTPVCLVEGDKKDSRGVAVCKTLLLIVSSSYLLFREGLARAEGRL